MKHGTTNAYAKGCRCDRCAAAKKIANARQRDTLPVGPGRAAVKASESIALTGGAWVPRDGIMRWEVGPKPSTFLFPEDERRDAHRRYWLGDRSPSVVAGEREYQRDAKRRARAARRAMNRGAA